jgi:hypothetical protein
MTYASHQAPAGAVQQPHQQQKQHKVRQPSHKDLLLHHSSLTHPFSPLEQTIYLIRHGEGYHNVGMDHNLDAHLTPRGWAQTAALNQHLQAHQEQLGIQVNRRHAPGMQH